MYLTKTLGKFALPETSEFDLLFGFNDKNCNEPKILMYSLRF